MPPMSDSLSTSTTIYGYPSLSVVQHAATALPDQQPDQQPDHRRFPVTEQHDAATVARN